MHRNHHRGKRIHKPLTDFIALTVKNRRVGHQMPHVTDKHERAPLKHRCAPIRRAIGHVVVKLAGKSLAAFANLFLKVALHKTKPVAIGTDLVLCIHTGNRILAIHDRRKRAFKRHIIDPRRIRRADLTLWINLKNDMQAIVFKQDTRRRSGIPDITRKLRPITQGRNQGPALYAQARRIRPRAIRQRHRLIKKCLGPCNHPRPATRVIALTLRQIAQRISAIKRVIKAAPTRIRGV